MPRSTRSEIDLLLQEARALELLADETAVPLERTQEYWDLAAELITLVTDIEESRGTLERSTAESSEMLQLRRRMRDIASALMHLESGA